MVGQEESQWVCLSVWSGVFTALFFKRRENLSFPPLLCTIASCLQQWEGREEAVVMHHCLPLPMMRNPSCCCFLPGSCSHRSH